MKSFHLPRTTSEKDGSSISVGVSTGKEKRSLQLNEWEDGYRKTRAWIRSIPKERDYTENRLRLERWRNPKRIGNWDRQLNAFLFAEEMMDWRGEENSLDIWNEFIFSTMTIGMWGKWWDEIVKLIRNETREMRDERCNGYITGILSMYEMWYKTCDTKQQ